MNYFFSDAGKLTSPIDWTFTLNHIFLVLIVAFLVVISYLAFSAKLPMLAKRSKIILAFIIILLEGGRLAYNAFALSLPSWWQVADFDLGTLMLWLSVITLLFSAFSKKHVSFARNMAILCFALGFTSGLLSLTYPSMLNGDFPLFHVENLFSLIKIVLLLLVPLVLLKSFAYSVRLKYMKPVAFGSVIVGSILLAAAQFTGVNFSYILKIDFPITALNKIPEIYHILLLFTAVMLVYFLLAVLSEILFFKKFKKHRAPKVPALRKFTKFSYHLFSVLVLGVSLASLVFIPTLYAVSPIKNITALYCLAPLPFILIGLIIAKSINKKAYLPKAEKVKKNAPPQAPATPIAPPPQQSAISMLPVDENGNILPPAAINGNYTPPAAQPTSPEPVAPTSTAPAEDMTQQSAISMLPVDENGNILPPAAANKPAGEGSSTPSSTEGLSPKNNNPFFQ